MLPGYTQKIQGAKTNKFRLSRTSSACSDIQFNESDQVKLINYIIHREESFINRKEKPLHDQSLIDEIQRILNEDSENANVSGQSTGKRHLSGRNPPNDSLNSSGRNSSARISSSSSSVDDESKNDDNNNNKNPNLQSRFIEPEFKGSVLEDNWMTIKGDFVMVYAVGLTEIWHLY